MVGNEYGQLTVVSRKGTDKFKSATWECSCTCGRSHVTTTAQLRRGSVVSCGCKRAKGPALKHGLKGHELYHTWVNMHQRCQNVNHPRYKDWGGRGISVCPEWSSFEVFLRDVGERPLGKTLDRTDNNGDYEPGNVKWSTPAEQNSNKRGSKFGPVSP